MMRKVLVAGAALLLAAGCMGGPSSTQSVKKAGEQSGGLFGMSKADQVTVTTGKAFKGVEEVIIGNFVVGFGTKKTDSSKAGGGLMGSGFGGKSTAHCDLTGVDDATMQEITEIVYAIFLKDLEAKGIKVADRAQLLNSEDFKGTNTLINPHEESSGGIFGAKSITKYFAPKSLGPIRPFMGDIAGVIGGFGFSNPTMGASAFADKSGKKVISVVYVVDFANTDKYGGWATSTSSISVGQGLTVIPNLSKISLIGGHSGSFSSNTGSVALGQPVTSDKPFADVVDATSDTSKTLEVAANVIGILGGVGSNSSRSYEFKARPGDFRDASIDAIGQANAKLVGTIASLK